MIKRLPMRRIFLFGLVVLFLGLISCGSRPSVSASSSEVPLIDVEAAMADLQPALKLSDFGKDVCYIPLETNDSCQVSLVSVKVFDGNIVVSSRQFVVLNFDKETGRFIAQLGHRGEDPEGYWGLTPYYNESNGLFYFERLPNQLQKYDAQGKYRGKALVPTPPERPCAYAFEDSLVIGYYDMPSYTQHHAWQLSCFTERGELKDSVLRAPDLMPSQRDDKVVGMMWLSMAQINFTMDAAGVPWIDLQSRFPLWKCGGQVRLKEGFGDTIFTLKDHHRLVPAYAFRYGDLALNAKSRREGKSRGKLVAYAVLETPEKIFFKAVRGLYESVLERHVATPGENGRVDLPDFELYNGIYDKQTGITRMAPEAGGIVDDLSGDLSFEIRSCSSPQGEFVFSLEAHEVVAWLEKHPEAKDNPRLAPLLEVKEGDNPVVVIVADK